MTLFSFGKEAARVRNHAGIWGKDGMPILQYSENCSILSPQKRR